MAVSQYFRGGSLIDAVTSHFTPDVVRKASSLTGESESSTRSALTGAVPTVLHGVVNMASSREGANSLTNLIRDGGYGAATESVDSMFSGGRATNNIMSSGTQLLGRLFGNSTSSVANAVAQSSGVSSGSATKIMSLVAPLTLGVLGKRAASQGGGLSGISNELMEQKSQIAAAAPSGLSKILGTGPTLVRSEVPGEQPLSAPNMTEHYPEPLTATERSEYPSEAAREGRRYVAEPAAERRPYAAEPTVRRGTRAPWLPLLIAAVAVALAIWLIRSRAPRGAQQIPVGTELSRITLPDGHSISVIKGSLNDNLAAFLGGRTSGSLPKTFVFDHLNFQSGTSQLTPESTATVNNLSEILKAYPNSRVELVGHTDNTGTPDANQTLSVERANAVKGMLVNQGVAEDRVTANGFGQTRPVASNDTEEGRARNRRTELNVLSR